MHYVKKFSEISMKDVNLFGGKNASLGEMIQHLASLHIKIPDGFAISTRAYFEHIKRYKIDEIIKKLLAHKKKFTPKELQRISKIIRKHIEAKPLAQELVDEILTFYKNLCLEYKVKNCDVAVRSSASSEDSPTASFAGQQESFLGISEEKELIKYTKKCMSSLFTERAILYRIEKNFDHLSVGISVGVQKMIRSDLASSGVGFSLDPETGFSDVITIESVFGVGEKIVQGEIIPDTFVIHKTLLQKAIDPIIKKEKGEKSHKKNSFSISDTEAIELAKMIASIENHYSSLNKKYTPMDIEWAKDGIDNQLYIIQARPETIFRGQKKSVITEYTLAKTKNKPILQGQSIGNMIVVGAVRKITSKQRLDASIDKNVIFVTKMTTPDLMPFLKNAAGIITEKGGRTCHAAIISRELKIPAIIGVKDALKILKNGEIITLDCSTGSEGFIYQGKIAFNITEYEIQKNIKIPIPIMINIADPDSAFSSAQLPVSGVGLLRMEFIISNRVKIHPMAAINYKNLPSKIKKNIEKITTDLEPKDFYVKTLAQSISQIAASFYPREVVVRFSDFKTNEYAQLIGGEMFEKIEDNPMLGFRGAMRYIDSDFMECFLLECAAIRYVVKNMSLDNITLLIPFVRTPQEIKKIKTLLKKGKLDSLKCSMMIELPANLFDFDEYVQLVDGFSIGSNDLFQMTFGVDRDSEKLAGYINEMEQSFLELCEFFIEKAKKNNKEIGICGQAPSDFKKVRDFLISSGISYISLNTDSVLKFIQEYQSVDSKN